MKILKRSLSWLVTLLLPAALTFLGLRLLLTQAFPEIEYRMPGFPADDYGFSLQDRLKWSRYSVEYLLNTADISFLRELTFPDGSSLFTDRELSHMQDVKAVVRPVLCIGYGVWFLVLGIGLWARFGDWWQEFVRGKTRRLADGGYRCSHRSFRSDQFLAVLYDFSFAFLQRRFLAFPVL